MCNHGYTQETFLKFLKKLMKPYWRCLKNHRANINGYDKQSEADSGNKAL